MVNEMAGDDLIKMLGGPDLFLSLAIKKNGISNAKSLMSINLRKDFNKTFRKLLEARHEKLRNVIIEEELP